MKYLTVLLFLTSSGLLWAEEQILSKADDRRARVIGITGDDTGGSLRLMVGDKVAWDYGLHWGSPNQAVMSWSTHSSKVAISVRTTKWSSELHVFDIIKQGKEIAIPDMNNVAAALNSGYTGRYEHVTPVGWIDDDTLIVKCTGNLVESGSDGVDDVNYAYQVTLNLPARRIVSVTCMSSHNVNHSDKNIEQTGAAQPAVVPDAKQEGNDNPQPNTQPAPR